jgi:hypothetical protein
MMEAWITPEPSMLKNIAFIVSAVTTLCTTLQRNPEGSQTLVQLALLAFGAYALSKWRR